MATNNISAYEETSTLGRAVSSNSGTILINDQGEEILLASEPGLEQSGDGSLPRDSAWVRQSFVTYQSPLDTTRTGVLLQPQDRYNRHFSTAVLKYTDSSPGGNRMINPPPQFTPYADICQPRLMGDTHRVSLDTPHSHQSLGMGRYYSEAIDDNAQVIHLRFGVASFNSLSQFFLGFYSTDLASMARGARYTDDFLTKWSTKAGNLLGLAIAPLFIIPMAMLQLGAAVRYFLNTPGSKFYSLKPSMPVYWIAVESLVNQLAVNSGLSAFVDTSQSSEVGKGGDGVEELTVSKTMNMVGRFLPKGLIQENGTIAIKAVANRANRMEIAFQNRMSKAFKDANPKDKNVNWEEVVRRTLGSNPMANFKPESDSIEVYFTRFLDFVTGNKNGVKEANSGSFETDPRAKGYSEDGKSFTGLGAFVNEVGNYFISNANDGSEFVSYRVDYTGPATENFESSAVESSIAGKINGMSRANRETRFNVADGNLGGGIGLITDAIRGLVSGVSQIVGIDGLAALAGSAFVDIPKHWNESTARLAKSNYNITLISPYGNPVSRLFNIWMPLATLLAGALPLATGKQSHTSPFLVELHDRGRCMTRLGIIDSMTITRGTSNLGFDKEGNAMAIEVSFSILDLSTIVAMPIHQGFSILNPLEGLFDSDNSFSDYLSTLAAFKLADTIYRIPILKYNINRVAANMQNFFTAASLGSMLSQFPGVDLLGAAMRGTDRQ